MKTNNIFLTKKKLSARMTFSRNELITVKNNVKIIRIDSKYKVFIHFRCLPVETSYISADLHLALPKLFHLVKAKKEPLKEGTFQRIVFMTFGR